MTTTVVTALYDIGREHLKGKYAYRPFEKYLDWFKSLLLLNVPMVIFIPPELKQYVLDNREKKYQTKIIIKKFEQLSAYQYHDTIQTIINKMRQKDSKDYFDDCPEFMTAKYETIIFSKFDFLKEVANNNPYHTEYFIWLDAGTFYQTPPFDYTLPWPDPYKMKTIKDKFLVPDWHLDESKELLKDKKLYLTMNDNAIYAYMLGGNKNIVNKIHKYFWQEVDRALSLGVINNEQHLLALMIQGHPEYYHLWSPTATKYPTYSTPIKDRMIPYELSIGTRMLGEHYPINPNIKLLMVASENIKKEQYQKWEITAKYYGYNYEVLGRNTKWVSFNTKIRLCYERLQQIKEPYTMITDGTDLFMCAPSDETYDKLINKKVNLLVGGECGMFYQKGKYDKEIIKKYLESIKQSDHFYPNGGFVLGKTDQVLLLMKNVIDYEDDQGGYYDILYEKKMNFAIDYDTAFIANILDYGDKKTSDYFIFDNKTKRYINKSNGEMPIALHFPGKYWKAMDNFWKVSQLHIVESSLDPIGNNDNNWIFWFILIIAIIIIIFIVIYLLMNY